MSEYRKQYYDENRDEIVARANAWQRTNREAHNQHVADYAKRNPEVGREASRRYIEKNKGDLKYVQRCMIIRTKSRAKKEGLEFNLTVEDIQAIWPADNKCPVYGFDFDLMGRDLQRCASIDKINPSGGYVTGNVAIISFRANSIKKNSTREELRMLLEFLDNQALQE